MQTKKYFKMKKILIITILSLFVISCKESAANKINKENLEIAKERDQEIKLGGAKLNFDKTEHDFGIISEGDIVETIFKFTNTGKSELIITSAKGNCGCTVPDWPRQPILPGETGEIKVEFNSKGRPNLQQKNITITANTANGKEIIKVRAQVTPKPKINLNS